MNLKVLEVVKSDVTTYNHINKSELEHENETVMAKMNHKQYAKPRYFVLADVLRTRTISCTRITV